MLRLAANLLASAAFVGFGLIAAAALSRIGHRWADILAQFSAPSLAAVFAMLLACLVLRLWPAALVGAGAALLLLLAVWPQWAPPRGRPDTHAPAVRLYSANLWAWNQQTEAIDRSIRSAEADMVILVELGDAPAAQLDRMLAAYPHRVSTPRIDRPTGAARTVIASRWPIVRTVEDKPDGLHAIGAVIDSPLGPLNLVAVHLTRPWPYQYQWGQITQVMALTKLRAGLTGPVIVAGDFNSVSSARIGRQVQSQIGLIPAPGFPGTWPTRLPAFAGMTIDQVYRSPDLALVRRGLGAPTGSDHRPVVTEFRSALR